MFLPLLLLLTVVGKRGNLQSILTYAVLLLPFTAVSGWLALLHRKLPKQRQEKANWFSRSIFNIHPYVTFLVFLGMEGLLLYGYLTGMEI